MPTRPESTPTPCAAPPALRELQVRVLDAILGAAAAGGPGPNEDGIVTHEILDHAIVENGIAAARRLGVYANNAAANFLTSLRASHPVVEKLVGAAYFARCVREYRRAHPSRSGDLQHAGAAFADYWRGRHGMDQYRCLADVARFEWLIQESLTAADEAPFDFERLGDVAPEDYDRLRFRLHAAARLFASPFPIQAIWAANAADVPVPPVIDLDSGGDRLVIGRGIHGILFLPLSAGETAFAAAAAAGAAFAAAVAIATRADAEFDASAALQKLVLGGVIVDFWVDFTVDCTADVSAATP
jgi:hypothetical protein